MCYKNISEKAREGFLHGSIQFLGSTIGIMLTDLIGVLAHLETYLKPAEFDLLVADGKN